MSKPTPQQPVATPPVQQKQTTSTSLNLLGFVPALVVQHFLKTLRQPRVALPESQHVNSVVMFADISGFTNLTETLSKIGQEGAEVMAFAINRYMELLVKSIGRSGGDIFKFAGDAMIVLWPPPDVPDGNQFEQQEQLKTLMRQAIQSAMDIQDKLNEINILDKIKLSVKIGFGVGDINIIYVGGVFARCEYLATGDPLTQAFESEHHAKKGGETIVSRKVFELTGEFFEFEIIPEEEGHHPTENGPFYYVKDYKNKKIKFKAGALLIKNNLTATAFELIKSQIMSYIPAALLPFIEIDQEAWSAELRRLTIMFVNLGIDLSDAKTKEGLKHIQKVIETVQKCIYYHQGSVNKLLMDDKGSTLIVVFGLPPMSHQDDPVRAILSSYALIKELGAINCKCSIGIATGNVYAGVIGTSGSRREYSVLGDSVNLSARLMQLACTETVRKIICCEITASGAQHKLAMKYYKLVKLKGKEKDLPVFEPCMQTAEEIHMLTKVDFFSDVKTHQNSLILNDQMLTDGQVMQRVVQKYFNMVGRAKETHFIDKITEAFLRKIDPFGFIVIRGSYGIGKSLLIRMILYRIKSDEHKFLQTKEEGCTIIVSSLGPMSKTLKMNGFRQVLQQLLVAIAKKKKQEVSLEFLQTIVPLKDVSAENYETFKELCGLKPNEWIHNFPPKEQYILPEKLKTEKKELTKMGLQLFSHFTDQAAQKPQLEQRKGSIASQPSDNSSEDDLLSFLPEQAQDLYPLLVILEDLNLYDALSFHMIKQVFSHFRRILCLATVRDQYSEQPAIKKNAPEEKKSFPFDDIFGDGLSGIEEVLANIEKVSKIKDINGKEVLGKYFHTLDLKPLQRTPEREEIKQLIKQQLNFDGLILDKDKVILAPVVSEADQKCIDKKLNDHLIFYENKPWLWQAGVYELFNQYLHLRTLGNPLAVMNIMQSLVRNRLINISDKNPNIGIINEQLRQVLDNEETIMIEAPQCWIQVNGPIIDKLGCLEGLLMKVASVIGDVFDIQTLNRIQPFKDAIQSEKLIKILQELEALDLLETLDVSEYNIFYRFTHPFMREVIYQRMTFNQRRSVHRSVAEAIQTMTHPFEQEENKERKRLEFHWTQAEQKWSLTQTGNQSHPDKFSHKAKRSIIVKQIQQILSRSKNENNSIIKKGMLEKKSDKNVTWASRFVLISSKEFKYYYTENDYIQNIDPLGCVPLKNIFGLVPLNQKEQGNKDWAFQLASSTWIKKKQEMPLRKFFFAANSEDQLEEWIIYLEFTKAKAIYDDFVTNFGKISFPLGQNQDNYDQNIRIDIQNKPKKINFGWGGITENKPQQNMSRRASRASKALVPTGNKYKDKLSTDDPFANVLTSQNEINLIKNLIKVFLRKSTLQFYAHIFEMSLQKNEESYKKFGTLIKITQDRKGLFLIQPNDIIILRQAGQKHSQILMNRQELLLQRTVLTSDSEDNSSSPLKSNDIQPEDQPPTTSLTNIFMTRDLRRSSAVAPSTLTAIKEEDDEKRTTKEFQQSKTKQLFQVSSKQDTQDSENYISDKMQESRQKNIKNIKQFANLKILGVQPEDKKKQAQMTKTKVVEPQKQSSNQFLPLVFNEDSDDDDSQRQSTKQPIKFISNPKINNKNDDNNMILSKTPEKLQQSKISQQQTIEEKNKSSERVAVRECYSLKGYQFFLQKGDKVSIKKLYPENEFAKCSYKNMMGILKKSDLAYTLPQGLPSSLQSVNGVAEQIISATKSQVNIQKQSISPAQQQRDDIDRLLSQVKPIQYQLQFTPKYQY